MLCSWYHNKMVQNSRNNSARARLRKKQAELKRARTSGHSSQSMRNQNAKKKQELEMLQKHLQESMREWQGRKDQRAVRAKMIDELVSNNLKPRQEIVESLATRIRNGDYKGVGKEQVLAKAQAMIILFQRQNPTTSTLARGSDGWAELGIDPEEVIVRQSFLKQQDNDDGDEDNLSELSDLSDSE